MTEAQKEKTTQVTVANTITTSGDPLKVALYSAGVKSRFEEMLGKRAPSFMSSIISAVNANAQLKTCDPMSVISAASIAASMELPINSSLGLAHIVPYKGKAQFQVGWKGFVQLALRSGQYKTINLARICEGEIVEHNKFTGEIKFDAHQKTSDNIVGYLLYFRLLNGYEKYFYMTSDEIHAHAKKYSASFKKGYGIWVDDFEAMALKTVCKLGLSKYGILSLEMQRAIEVDQGEVNDHGHPTFVDNPEVANKIESKEKVAGLLNKYTVTDEGEVVDAAFSEIPNPFEAKNE